MPLPESNNNTQTARVLLFNSYTLHRSYRTRVATGKRLRGRISENFKTSPSTGIHRAASFPLQTGRRHEYVPQIIATGADFQLDSPLLPFLLFTIPPGFR